MFIAGLLRLSIASSPSPVPSFSLFTFVLFAPFVVTTGLDGAMAVRAKYSITTLASCFFRRIFGTIGATENPPSEIRNLQSHPHPALFIYLQIQHCPTTLGNW
ncbi:MAG: hypothetical protein RIC55_07870 [Pirellulaceae bacterium]